MVTLEGKADVNLLSSDGNIIPFIPFGKETPIMISVDVPMNEEVKIMGINNSFSITSDNCIFDARTVDYVCGFLSPAEYKMPKKKSRKQIRYRKRFKKIRRVILTRRR